MKQHTLLEKNTLPAIWLILLIVGLPLFSETVYTPSLPDIAHALSVSDSWVEYTLTIYLFGLAVGTLFWGKLSDAWGRKPCVIAGFAIFLLGCLGCYLSDSINWLMTSRFIQAFGGSVGSVLGQAICRDAFHGPALGRVYSSVGGALAIFPAVGPIVGGLIDQNFGWAAIFLFLIGFGIVLISLTGWFLPETHPAGNREKVKMKIILLKMARDRQVIGLDLLVAASNGITFSYYAEGPFYMIELLKLSPSQFGSTFIGLALATLVGGLLGRKLHNHYDSMKIMTIGLSTLLLGTILFVGFVFLISNPTLLIWGTIVAMMIIMGGGIIVNSNALSMALVNYKNCIGTASSLFGFSYYVGVSLFTYGMGYFHNGTVFLMPIYFCAIAFFMILVKKMMLTNKYKH